MSLSGGVIHQVNVNDVEPIEQRLTERAGRTFSIEVTTRSGDGTDAGKVDGRGIPQHMLLQEAQELPLSASRQRGDVVNEERASASQLEVAPQ